MTLTEFKDKFTVFKESLSEALDGLSVRIVDNPNMRETWLVIVAEREVYTVWVHNLTGEPLWALTGRV